MEQQSENDFTKEVYDELEMSQLQLQWNRIFTI